MKKICIDVRSLENDNRYRGIGYFVYHLVKNILVEDRENSYNLICANPKDNQIIREFGHKPNIKVTLGPKSGQSYFKYLLQSQLFLAKLLFQERFDTYLSLDSLPVIFWPRKTQFIFVIHDLIPIVLPKLTQSSRGKKIELFLASKMSRRADKVITVSECSMNDIVKYWHVDADKIEVIYEAADSKFKPIPTAEKKSVQDEFCQGDRYLLYVGEIGDPRKNLLLLLNVFSRLRQKKKFDNLKFLLVGAAKSHNNLYNQLRERVKALSLDNGVIFPGFLPEAKLRLVLAGSEVFLFPSTYEGFGLPVLQACACGVPVVAYNNSSISEIFSKAVWLVPNNNPESFAAAVEALLSDKKIYGLFQNKGLLLAKNFSWQKTSESFINLFGKK